MEGNGRWGLNSYFHQEQINTIPPKLTKPLAFGLGCVLRRNFLKPPVSEEERKTKFDESAVYLHMFPKGVVHFNVVSAANLGYSGVFLKTPADCNLSCGYHG